MQQNMQLSEFEVRGLFGRYHHRIQFPVGSVTKQFTAMCILTLQEDHKLNVTNLISQYVEDSPEAWRKNYWNFARAWLYSEIAST